jgi:phosphoserine aminotransferase
MHRITTQDQLDALYGAPVQASLAKEKAAYDIAGHRDGPPALRIWCGSTVETADVAALTPWLDWAFAEAKAGLAKAA